MSATNSPELSLRLPSSPASSDGETSSLLCPFSRLLKDKHNGNGSAAPLSSARSPSGPLSATASPASSASSTSPSTKAAICCSGSSLFSTNSLPASADAPAEPWPAAAAAFAPLIRRTWALIVPEAQAHALYLYDRLMEAQPDIRRLFEGVDMPTQAASLMEMLDRCVQLVDSPALAPILHASGRRHARFGMRDTHLQELPACLTDMLERGLGAAWTPEVREAWAWFTALIDGEMRAGMQSAGRTKRTAEQLASALSKARRLAAERDEMRNAALQSPAILPEDISTNPPRG